MTFDPPSDQGPAPSFSDSDASRETWKGGEYRREHPILLLVVGLLIGAIIGAYASGRKRKQKYAVQAAKEWLDAAYEQLAEKLPQLVEKLPQLVEKLPQTKKPTALWCQAAFLDQAREAGKKLKWW
ncbi:MAG: hypothetical protein WBW78_14835 [Terrimicrobiaceae bacterium]